MKTMNENGRKDARIKERENRLDAVGLGLFFIWVGIAILADVGWGVGCIGVGLLILTTMVIRNFTSRFADDETVESEN